MTPHLQPEGLRTRAKQCRTLAETFQDKSVKAKMLNIAEGYEQMADTAEGIAERFGLTPHSHCF
jgi:hypothetical protein